jgi:hypothetical protein
MDSAQLVFNNEGGNVTAAGYLIDSFMLQHGQPAAVMTGGSSLLDALKLGDLAVPLGLFYLQDLAKKSSDSFNTSVFELYDENVDGDSSVELVEDSLYEKLLAMVEGEDKSSIVSKKAKMTRKRKSLGGASKKTRVRRH